jgi:ADP-heptose:LPS heptosyltransferase
VDLSATGRSRRLLAGVRASRRLRVRKQTLRRFAFVKLRALGGSGSGLVPLLDRMFAAVAPLGVWREGRRPHFPGPPPPLDGPVLLAPGAGRATKRWPAERFGEVARRLSAEGERVVVAGAEAERRLLEEVARGSAAEVVAVADPSGIPDVAARSPRAVTNDSAWLHVAEACGATVVAIFGPTHPSLGFAPAAPGSVAIHAGVACSPCDLHGPDRCPKRHHRCMGDVTAERVLAELRARRQARSAA